MTTRGSGPAPSKIIVSGRRESIKGTRGASPVKTRSWPSIAACFFPVIAFGLSFLLGGVLGEGNPGHPYYVIGVLALLLIVGIGAGIGFGALFEPRRSKLAPVLSFLLNTGSFLFVAGSIFLNSQTAARTEFEELTTPDTVSQEPG